MRPHPSQGEIPEDAINSMCIGNLDLKKLRHALIENQPRKNLESLSLIIPPIWISCTAFRRIKYYPLWMRIDNESIDPDQGIQGEEENEYVDLMIVDTANELFIGATSMSWSWFESSILQSEVFYQTFTLAELVVVRHFDEDITGPAICSFLEKYIWANLNVGVPSKVSEYLSS